MEKWNQLWLYLISDYLDVKLDWTFSFRLSAVKHMQQNHGDVKVAKRKFCDEFATELDGQNPPNKKFFYRNNAKFEEHGTVENLVCFSYISILQ